MIDLMMLVRFGRSASSTTVVVAALTVIACGDNSPSQPTQVSTPVAAPVAPPRRAISHVVTGSVTDDAGRHVPNASVAFYPGSQIVTVITDAAGMYRAEFDTVYGGLEAMVQKPGFETGRHWALLNPERTTTRDMRLHQIVAIRAGERLALTLRPDEGACGFDLEYWCRRVRVNAATAGTLTMRVDGEEGGPAVGLVTGYLRYPFTLTPALSLTVAGNSETEVDLLAGLNLPSPLRVTLSTSLE